MSVYILAATAHRAVRSQREHDAAEGGWWCKACFKAGRGKIAAGKCEQYELAQGFLDAYRRQRSRKLTLPRPPRGGGAAAT